MLKKKLLAESRQSGSIMTLPDERYRAVLAAEQFLEDLMDPKKTPRVSKEIRQRARSVLRHYPSRYDMDRAATVADHVFATQTPVEDLHEFIMKGLEQRK